MTPLLDRPLLNGPPEFILLVLITGMIYFYSQVLNRVIKKRRDPKSAQPNRLYPLALALFISEVFLLFGSSLVVIRIFLHFNEKVYLNLDLAVLIIFALAHVSLIFVFCFSYLKRDTRAWIFCPNPSPQGQATRGEHGEGTILDMLRELRRIRERVEMIPTRDDFPALLKQTFESAMLKKEHERMKEILQDKLGEKV